MLYRKQIVPYFLWIYVIGTVTFYISNNTIDNMFQLICACIMCLSILLKKSVYVSKAVGIYLLLILFTILPDITTIDLSLIKKIPAVLFPVICLCYMENTFKHDTVIPESFFKIPVYFGTLISLQGILMELCSFLGILSSVPTYIEKTDNTIGLTPGFMGVASVIVGQVFGKNVYRIQGYFIEPSKFCMFLIIPFFYSIGLYRVQKSRKMLFCSVIVFMGIILSFSRAGWIAVLSAFVVLRVYKGDVRKKRCNKNIESLTSMDIAKAFLLLFFIVAAAFLLIWFLVYIVTPMFPAMAHISFELTDSNGKLTLMRVSTYDFPYLLEKIRERPFGWGISHTDHGLEDFDTNLANALIMWTMCGGVFGLVIAIGLIAFLFFKYCIPSIKSDDYLRNMSACAFVALTMHSLSYGNWCTAEYMANVAIMILLVSRNVSFSRRIDYGETI